MHDAPFRYPPHVAAHADAIVIAAMRGEPARNLDLSRQSYRCFLFAFAAPQERRAADIMRSDGSGARINITFQGLNWDGVHV